MFALVLFHNWFNRRRYRGLPRAWREPRGIVDTVVMLAMIGTMLVLLATSLMISNAVFSGLELNGGFTAKQIHTLAAYWALVIVSIHLGLRWPTIMGAVRNLCGVARAPSLCERSPLSSPFRGCAAHLSSPSARECRCK